MNKILKSLIIILSMISMNAQADLRTVNASFFNDNPGGLTFHSSSTFYLESNAALTSTFTDPTGKLFYGYDASVISGFKFDGTPYQPNDLNLVTATDSAFVYLDAPVASNNLTNFIFRYTSAPKNLFFGNFGASLPVTLYLII